VYVDARYLVPTTGGDTHTEKVEGELLLPWRRLHLMDPGARAPLTWHVGHTLCLLQRPDMVQCGH
jgi:hypothetical protein